MVKVSVEVGEVVFVVQFGVSLEAGQVFVLFHPDVPVGDEFIFVFDLFGGFFEAIQLKSAHKYFAQELL